MGQHVLVDAVTRRAAVGRDVLTMFISLSTVSERFNWDEKPKTNNEYIVLNSTIVGVR